MKLKAVSGITLALFLIGMLAGTSNVASASNSWWNDDWQNRRKIDIIENSGYNLIDFPVEVTFQHNGHAQLDGDDIRIVDDGIETPSYITNINSTHATVMFETDILASSTRSLYVYYGNPSAIAPNYPLVPLTISEGNTGYATIDNSVYIGWEYCKWGWDGDNNEVVLWTDFKIDFNKDGSPLDDNDLLTDVGGRRGGIGRFRIDYGNMVVRSFGLGNYTNSVQTPIYVDVVFDNATLRVYKRQTWVETKQADRLLIWGSQWDYGKSGTVSEQNVVDGLDTTHDTHTWIYQSYSNPLWMAFRNSGSGDVIAGSGFNIEPSYMYFIEAKEFGDWDRDIWFDVITIPETLAPNDQPPDCRIYWYGDNSNNYTKIEEMATVLDNKPSVIVGNEEYPPTPPPSVGGKATPINIGFETELQNSWLWLTTILLPLLATVIYVKLWKKKQ